MTCLWKLLASLFLFRSRVSICPFIDRNLTLGLKDLTDFLPASLATIVSYFSAEVTRGVWKPAFMNGTDWPSPAANLSTVEEQIKKIVADTGVDVPSLVAGMPFFLCELLLCFRLGQELMPIRI